jgi:hypothetical protein
VYGHEIEPPGYEEGCESGGKKQKKGKDMKQSTKGSERESTKRKAW